MHHGNGSVDDGTAQRRGSAADEGFLEAPLDAVAGTAIAEVQKKLQLPLRTRKVQLLGLTLERGHAAPLDTALAVETLSRGGHLDLADSNSERDHRSETWPNWCAARSKP